MKNNIKDLLIETPEIRDFENVRSILGKKLGGNLIAVFNEAQIMDKELDIVHEVLMDLYNHDNARPTIIAALNRIEILRNKKQ